MVLYYQQNENKHGDITHLTNVDEEIENSYSYDVFGNIAKQQENIENVFKYAGEQQDSETEQYYLRARFYNPVVGRFTQEDVYRGNGLNLYVYVINNPLLWIDPSGYAKEGCRIRAYQGIDDDILNERYDIVTRDRTFTEMSIKLNENLVIEMPYKGRTNDANSAGYLRDNMYYFEKLYEVHPEYFSPNNVRRLQEGFSIMNDETFRRYFPEYDVPGLRSDYLVHHHIGGGGQAVAVPSKIHKGFGGIHNNEKQLGIWNNNIQPITSVSSSIDVDIGE